MSDTTATLRIKAVMENSDVISNINQIQNRLEALKMPKDLTDRTKAKFEELTGLVKEYQNLIDKPHKSSADLRRLDQLNVQIKKIEKEAEKMIRSFDFSQIDTSKIDSAAIQKLNRELDEARQKITQITKNSFDIKPGKGMDNLLSKIKEAQKAAEGTGSKKTQNLFKQLTEGINAGNLNQITNAIKELDKYLKPGAFNGVDNVLKPFKEGGVSANIHKIITELQKADSKFMQTAHSAEQLEDAIKAEVANRLTEMAKEANQVGDGFREASNAAETYRDSVTHAAKQQSEMQMQVQNLQQQIKNYFGLDEIFRKIGDLARSAMDTVKELDAAMTETAVVTNFDVSDMWKMLPTYTKNANQLGSTIADVYNAATLYYQQGLTTTQSMALANETLKMARIGGIEAAEATDMMTAALRGFNMEINETSAQRINDVYSKLAAITAADTKEIGTAMERTASIANSANMDFETTSAFLAQMIETTREAPENLGTAMKTIVARFQEMKVDPSSLVDSEGQRLDFNRVDKALKSVGISLVDEQNQFRNLDDVFLEISSRWDGMTQAQQRYIATIAAGSRQQSRFIAMMQDYDRTMELVDAAYTAEGAGQAQFEKTLESMSSKLNRLKNAWDQFAMGFMNADFLKIGVDAGTKFLDIFEKLITGISKIGIIDPFQSIIKSALTATAVFGGLLAMSKLLMAGVGKFAGIVLGEEVARKSTGVVGMGANMVYGEDGSEKALKRRQAKERRDARIKELKAFGKEQAKIRNDGFEAGFQDYKTSGRGKLSNYFGELQAGSKAQKDIKNFQKQLGNMLSKGTFDSKGFVDAFSGMGRSAQNVLMPQIKGAFDKAIQSANLDEEGKKAAQRIIDSANARFNSGEIDIHGMLNQINDNLGQAGINPADVDANLGNIAQQMAPMSKVSAQFERIGVGAAKAGQSIQMFGANLMGTPLAPFGTALMVVGQLTENVGMLMNSGIAKIRAWGVAMVAAGADTALAGAEAGVATKFFAGLGKTIYKTLVPLLPYIAIAAGAAAAIGAIAYAATKSSRDFKRQGDAAAQASQDLDTTKQALEAVNNDLEELANNDAKLDGLIKGTTEWNNALAEANSHIIEMMQNYKSLNEIDENGQYKYIQTDDYGRMSITQAGQDEIRKEYENAVNLATANNAVQGALYNNLKDLNSKQYKDNKEAMQVNPVGSARYNQAKLQNENIEQMNEARLENAWKTGIHAAIADSGISNTKAIESILASQRDDLVNAVTLGNKTDNKKAYADLMGYEYVKKNTYKDAQGNELEIDYKTVKEMLPELQALSDAQANAASIQNSLNAAQSSYSTALAKSENKDLKNIKGQDTLISDILSSNAEANLDAVNAFVNSAGKEQTGLEIFTDQYKNYTEENAKILSDLTGTEVNSGNYTKALQDLKSQLQQNADNMIQQQQDAISGAAGILDAANWKKSGKGKEAEKAADEQIKNVIGKMTSAQINSMNQTAEGMSDNISNTISQSYGKTVADLVDSGASKETIDKFQDAFDGIDFSSGLATLEGFNKAVEVGVNTNNERIKQFGETWEASGEKADATAKAMQEVFSSDDFADIEESLTDVIKETGHLDSSAILTAAESSATLQRYLKATGASAEGVARAFELISGGKISLTDLTRGTVAAANAMEQLSASAGRANREIENFEIKNDTGKYGDAIDSQKEAIDEMIKNGEYGNEGIEQVLTQTFGAEKWAEAYKGNADGIKELYNKYTNIANKSAGDIASLYEDGFDVQAMLSKIQSEYEVTAEYADVLLQKAINSDIELKKNLEKQDKDKMIGAAMQANGMTIGDNGKITSTSGGMTSSGEIYTQALMYAGDDIEAQREYLNSYANALGVTLDTSTGDLKSWTTQLAESSTHVANFNSEMSGMDVEKEFRKEWRDQKNPEGTTWWSGSSAVEGKKDTYDVQKIVEQALANGANNTQAMEAAYAVIKRNFDKGYGNEFEVGGQKLTAEDVETFENFSSKFVEDIENAQWVEVGKTIGEQIVAAMQRDHFNSAMEASGVTGANPYTNSSTQNGVLETKIDAVWKEAQNNTSNRSLQVEAIGNYLKQNAPNFEKLDPSKQTEALNGLVAKMNDLNFSKEEIVSAINQGFDTHLTPDKVTGEEGGYKLQLNQEDLQGQLKGLEAEVTANITNVVISAKASGQNNYRLGTFARGSRGGYTISGRPTLTGEEGEELVWEPKRNEAYMVGSNGPQFANISRNAVVWNADQTKKIKKNSGSVGRIGTGARGITPFGTMSGGNAGGLTVGGTLNVDATATITETIPPANPPEVPVTGLLKIEGDEKGGLLSKLKSLGGDKKEGISVKVTAEATKLNVAEGIAPVKVTGDITKLNNTIKDVKGIKATATVNRVVKSGKVTGEPVKVKASAEVSGKASGTPTTATVKTKADNTAQKNINSIKHKGTVLIKTKADNAAQRAINAIKGRSVNVHIKPIFEGSWTKNAIVHVNTDANGQNNYIAHRTVPSFGSAADGQYGRLGPKGKGGLTLTGEKGFEIAWLPSENRSMILGVKGPQLINLPRDAVVWTNEQSKKIIQNKAIPAGSHANKPKINYGGGTDNLGGGATVKTYRSKSSYTSTKAGDKWTWTKSDGKIGAYVYNIEKKIEQSKANQERIQKKLNKLLEKATTTLASASSLGNQDINRLNQIVNLNKELVKTYNNQLKILATNQKATIKWEQEKTKGKKKKKETRSETINLGDFIYQDRATGAYLIDYNKINNSFNNKAKKEALLEELKKQIDEKISKRDSAQSALDEAQEKIEELGKSLYETFYSWRNELTKIYFITKKIEQLQSQINRFEQAIALEEALIGTGVKDASKALSFFRGQLNATVASINVRQSAITQQRSAVLKAASTSDEFTEYNSAQANLTNTKKAYGTNSSQYAAAKARANAASEQLAIARKAQSYITPIVNSDGTIKITFNETQLENDRRAGKISQSMYDGIKDIVDNITEENNKLNDLFDEQISALTDLYGTLRDLKEAYADRSEELLKAAEESQEQNLDKLEKLNDSLTNGLKNLIDEVKRQLDLRRKQEDNLEKENDIGNKLNQLAALRADSSGSNAKRIKQLEKEISDAQKSYGRELEDQVIQNLQDQADKASEQRERQIKILTDQLEYSKSTGANIALVNRYLADPKKYEKEIKALWMENNDYENQTKARQKVLDEDWNSFWADIQKEGLPSKIDSTTKAINDTKTILNNIKSTTQKLANDLANRGRGAISAKDQASVTKALIPSGGADLRTVIKDLKAEKATNAQIQQRIRGAKVTAKRFKSEGFSAKEASMYGGYSAAQLKAGGYSAKELHNQLGYGVRSLYRMGYSAKQLKDAGYGVAAIKKYTKYSNKQLKQAGFTIKDFRAGGVKSIKDLVGAGFSIKQLKTAGYTAKEFFKAGTSYKAAKAAGFSIKELANAGYKEAKQELKKYEKSYKDTIASVAKDKKISQKELISVKNAAEKAGIGARTYLKALADTKQLSWKQVLGAAKKAGYDKERIALTFSGKTFQKAYNDIFGKNSYSKDRQNAQKKKKKVYAYKQGGLANFTGPAWLDGTKSKPELVLDAKDTQNFLALKDVLSKAVSNSKSINNNESNTFEINVNVDKISNDYDVDKMVERIKKKIVGDASYRNVNAVRLFR